MSGYDLGEMVMKRLWTKPNYSDKMVGGHSTQWCITAPVACVCVVPRHVSPDSSIEFHNQSLFRECPELNVNNRFVIFLNKINKCYLKDKRKTLQLLRLR